MTQQIENPTVVYPLPLKGEEYQIPFRYLAVSEINVFLEDQQFATIEMLVLGDDYDVSDEGDTGANEGTITLRKTPDPTAARMIITRNTTPIQNYRATPGAEGVEAQLDRTVLRQQEISKTQGRTIQLPRSYEGDPFIMEIPEPGRVQVGGADGKSIRNGPTVETIELAQGYALAAASIASRFLGPEDLVENAGNGVVDASPAFLQAHATNTTLYLKFGSIYRLATSVTCLPKIVAEGGLIVPDDGAFLVGNIDGFPGMQVFDISNLTPVQGKAINQHFNAWSMNGGLRTKATVHASWFGAKEVNADNSFALQAAFDATDHEVGIDGDYIYTAAFFNSAKHFSSKSDSGRARLIQKVQNFSYSSTAPQTALNAWGQERCFGVKCNDGVKDAVFERLEFDGQSQLQPDALNDLQYFRNGSGGFDKFRCNCDGLSFAADEDAAANNYVEAPDGITVNDCWFKNTIRNGVVGNYAGRVTINKGGGENSEMDHLAYFDNNKDTEINGFAMRGYAEGAMMVVSGATVNGPVCDSISANPHTGTYTRSIIQDRNDIGQVSTINDPRFSADFEQLDLRDDSEAIRHIFSTTGKHRMAVCKGSIEHTGDQVAFSVFGTPQNNLAYQGLSASGVQFLNMPSTARLINEPGQVVNNIEWCGGSWRYMSGSTGEAGALILAGSIDEGLMERVHFDGPAQGIGFNQIVSCDTGDLIGFRVHNQKWPQGNGLAEWATAAGNIGQCSVTQSWLRCGRPSDRNVRWRNSYYGTTRVPTEQTFMSAEFVGDGFTTEFALAHDIGDPPYFVSAIAVSGFSRAVDPIGVSKGTNTLDVIFDSPVANGQSAFVDITLQLTE